VEGPQPHTQYTFRDRHEPVNRSWSKDAYSMTVRAVCATCNNGWMAALEEQAKGFLDPMFHARMRAVDQVGQKTLATWALKTVMIAEADTRVWAARISFSRLRPPPRTRRAI
jgi:hypothetical protein